MDFKALLQELNLWNPQEDSQTQTLKARWLALVTSEEVDLGDSAYLASALTHWEDWGRNKITAPELKVRLLEHLQKSLREPERAPAPSQGLVTLNVTDFEVLTSFITEAQEHLEGVEQKVLSLETSRDPALVHDIFRAMHTIKGVASFLALGSIKSLAHGLESLLDDLRNDRLTIREELIELLLEGRDLLSEQIQELARKTDASGRSQGAGSLELQNYDIAGFLARLESARTPTSPTGPEEILITPEMLDKFQAEVEDLLESAEQCLLRLEADPKQKDTLDELFRLAHTAKGNAGFFGRAELETGFMELESELDRLRKGQASVDAPLVTRLLEDIDRLRGLAAAGQGPASPQEPARPALPSLHEVLSREMQKTEAASGAAPVVSEAKSPEGRVSGVGQGGAPRRKEVRVDTAKLDDLFDLIGELITAEAMVLASPELENLELSQFRKSAGYLSKITRELQATTMAMRMVPLDGLFSKMSRLVRDLSHKFKKEIHLNLQGQDTEMDRNIIEEISDPLIHLIRNALDHGIESPEVRRSRGKPVVGTLSLGARYEGNEIWISVKDDGNGLDRERILRSAVEKGLVEASRDYKDEEIYNFVFLPGFSTAQTVSEISGRGVGMDVVKRNLEKLRGRVEIRTEARKGTEFLLRIPLTLAIVDGITLTAGPQIFALPIGDVVEFQEFHADQVHQPAPGQEVFRLREEVLPLFRLRNLFQVKTREAAERAVLIILQNQNRKMALVVDRILGYQQIVIKSLPELMDNLPAVSGCALLGNGDVSLILDAGGLFDSCLA